MTYIELLRIADQKLNNNKITLGEYEEMIKPLEREVIDKSVLENIKAEIDNQYKWLMQTEHTLYDIDIAFDAIKSLLDKYIGKENE